MCIEIQGKEEQPQSIKPESLLYVENIVNLYIKTFERMRRLTRKQISKKNSPEKDFGILQNLTNILLQINRDQILTISKSIKQNPDLWIENWRYKEYTSKYRDGQGRPVTTLRKSTNYQDYMGEDGIDCLSFSINGFGGEISFLAEELDSPGARHFTLNSTNLTPQQICQDITFIIEHSKDWIHANGRRTFKPVKGEFMPPEVKDSFHISLPKPSSDLVPSNENRNSHERRRISA